VGEKVPIVDGTKHPQVRQQRYDKEPKSYEPRHKNTREARSATDSAPIGMRERSAELHITQIFTVRTTATLRTISARVASEVLAKTQKIEIPRS